MKQIYCGFLVGIILVAIVSVLRVRANDFDANLAFNTQSGTVLYATASGTNNYTTNSASFEVDANLYHTFQITLTCTSSITLTLDRSVDGVGWIPFSTNTASATTTNEVTMTGKWLYVRGRTTTVSNATVNVLYLGGR